MKVARQRAILVFGFVVLGVIALSLNMSHAQQRGGMSHPAQEGLFTLLDLRGHYGCAFDGEIVDAGPFAAMSWIDADGATGFSTRTLTLNGTVFQQTGLGTHQINANGTGSATYFISTQSPAGIPDTVETFDFVITNDRLNVMFVVTSPGVVAAGECRKLVSQ